MATSRSRARDIACKLSAQLTGYLTGKMSEEELVKRLRSLALQIEGEQVLRAPKVEGTGARLKEQEIFNYWQDRMNKRKAKFVGERRRVIAARTRDGYTVQQIKQAIDACSASEFHMGQNDRNTAYNDLSFILKSGERLERFLEMRTGQDHTHDEPLKIRRLMQEAEEAMQRGDTDAYNNANARIRDERAAG